MGATVKHVCFTITGEGLTRIARDFVQEKNWREALELLVENLRPGFTHEMAVEVLSGKKKLVGDSTVGLELVRDGDKATKEYMQNLQYLYGGLWRDRSHALYMQPYAMVVCWGPADLKGPGEYVNTWCGHHRIGRRGRKDRGNDSIWRSLYYADDVRNDRACALVAKRPDLARQEEIILFRPVPPPPLWVKTHLEMQDALDAWLAVKGHALNLRGANDSRWKAAHDRAAATWARNTPAEKEVKSTTGNDVVDKYLQDPDGTMAELTKEANKEVSKVTGEPSHDELYEKANNGWLNPEGKFHGCKYGLHVSTAAKLAGVSVAAEYKLEKMGWAKLTKGNWMWIKGLTSKQIAEIRGWYTDRGRKVPEKMTKKLAVDEGKL